MANPLASALRYARLFAQLRAARGGIANPIHICVSVDFDLRYKLNGERGYEIVEEIFARHGLTGRATYLINPRYDLGDNHWIYRDMHAKGYEIGLHTHAEQMIFEEKQPELAERMSAEKALVESRFTPFEPTFRIQSFRSGSRAFSGSLFRVLELLGIRYDSTMRHHRHARNVHGFAVEDGTAARRAYYLNPADFRAEAPAPTAIVEMPVTSQIPEIKDLAAALRPGEPLIIATFCHPYNFHFEGKPNRAFQMFYDFALRELTKIRGAQLSRLAQAGAAWEAWHAESNGGTK